MKYPARHLIFDAIAERLRQAQEEVPPGSRRRQKAEAASACYAVTVKPTEGLSPHEMGVLITITSSVSTPYEGMMPHKIKESMKRSGYTAMASTLALAGLKKKDMIEYAEESGYNESYTVYRLTDKGLA